jgi:uncharacterized membrane protein YjjP (DUF1212 family)
LSIDANTSITFLLRLGEALHAYGYSAGQLESVMTAGAARLGLEGQFFSTPTSILAALGAVPNQRTFLIRTDPGTIDLGKLGELDALQKDVLEQRLTPAEGLARVEAVLVAAKGRYGPIARVLATGLSSGCASIFLGGGLVEAAWSTVLGTIVGLGETLTKPGPQSARLFETAAACLAWLLAAVLARFAGPFSQGNVALAGVVVLLPGLMLTLAMSELATGHLASGSARLIGAVTVFVSLAIGVALGSRLALLLLGVTPNVRPEHLPWWAIYAVLPLAALGFAVVFRARPREILPIIVAGGLAIGGARLGARWLGADLGSFIGAFTAAAISNLFARVRRQPATLTLVPAIVLLVPGSIGFSSLSAMLNRDVVPGVESAFRTVLISVALATGLLIADVLVPARRRSRGSALTGRPRGSIKV